LTGTGRVHVWNSCHGCGMHPIVGLRFECQVCPMGPDNDLCEACYGRFLAGSLKHPSLARPGAHFTKRTHTFRSIEGKEPEEYRRWLAVVEGPPFSPTVTQRFLFRLVFQCGWQSFLGTYGFALVDPQSGKTLMLTALHVLDEIAKTFQIDCSEKNINYTGKELPALMSRVILYDGLSTKWMLAQLGEAERMMVLAEARTGEEEPYSQRDIAAFELPAFASIEGRKLANEAPQAGEPIWLVAHDAAKSENCFQAIVVESTERALVFKFRGRGAPPERTSGAPLMNAKGEIAGINVGRGRFEECWLGHATHAGSIRRHLGSGGAI
jgi:hypothetical protein